MLAELQLSEEEKFNVLLGAFVLFSVAALVALCLAISCCPLNRWLQERDEQRRRKRQQLAQRQFRTIVRSHQITSQQSYYTNYHSHHYRHNNLQLQQQQQSINNKCAPHQLASCLGPPPAYEAALRASRLQSLTSNSLLPQNFTPQQQQDQSEGSPDWLKTVLTNQLSEQAANERQLDLGDYFHSPKETLLAPAHQRRHHHLAIPMDPATNWNGFGGSSKLAALNRPQAPIMIRLWVKLLEPDELVRWAREQTTSARENFQRQQRQQQNQEQLSDRPRLASLTRQLSIPQLFDSLRTLAGGVKPHEAAPTIQLPADCDEKAGDVQQQQPLEELQPSSLSSTTTSSTSSSSTSNQNDEDDEQPRRDRQQVSGAASSQQHLLTGGSGAPPAAPTGSCRASRGRSSLPSVRSITSRVLHMNVASFSYVKDENFISTKKHNQLNFHHFHKSAGSRDAVDQTKESASKKEGNKMCQLLVSICDIENLLGSSCLENRACLRLAQNSSIYIKCEILANKTSTSRLLRNPLRVLTNQDSVASSAGTHTIDFGPTIPAAAMEPTPSLLAARATSPSRLQQQQPEPADSEQRNSLSGSSVSDDAAAAATTPDTSHKTRNRQQQLTTSHVNWRHEPNADGKAIVVFSSIPKQIAQQQQFAAVSSMNSRTATSSSVSTASAAHSLEPTADSIQQTGSDHIDLIQFDSVFVSPILSKSLLENGHIRLRVYAQCKYVNDTCLAELKLPLKQLMRAQSRDNLGDATTAGPAPSGEMSAHSQDAHSSPHQRQADFILNNLLANLVTASTGLPLSTLIECISAEERETADDEAAAGRVVAGAPLQRCSSSPGGSARPLAAWLGVTDPNGHNPKPNPHHLVDWRGEGPHGEQNLIEQNHCRSLMVSHWLNYLVAPSYECQRVEEVRGKLVLGLTYLPTSNRLVFNAHRASIEFTTASQLPGSDCHKQLVKRLRMQSDTSYLLRFFMVADDRILKRRQTVCARRPEWDSQEPVTFDLVNVTVERPTFVVALVMRNPHALVASGGGLGSSMSGSLQSLSSYDQLRPCGGGGPAELDEAGRRNPSGRGRACACQSDPESLRPGYGSGTCRPGFGSSSTTAANQQLDRRPAKAKRDFVVGHLVLTDELWHELKAQPRKQLVKQFKLL